MFSNKLFTVAPDPSGADCGSVWPRASPSFSLGLRLYGASHLQRAAKFAGRLLQLMVAINNLSSS